MDCQKDHASPLTKCVALEQIYSINSPHLVAPFSFTRNVLQYQAAQSLVNTGLNGKLGPCSGYTTITNWLTSQSTKPVAFPVFDSQVAFDNDQVVGRSWQVCMYPVRVPTFFSYVPKRESLFPNRASPLFFSSRTGITDYQKKSLTLNMNNFFSRHLKKILNGQKFGNSFIFKLPKFGENRSKNVIHFFRFLRVL